MKKCDQAKAMIPELRSYLKNRHGDFLFYTVTVTDKEGKVLKRLSSPSRSYVQQWNQLINVMAKNSAATVKDTAGVNRTAECRDNNLRANAGTGVTYMGIRIGKGTTPVAITDYALEFYHNTVAISSPSVQGSTCSFTISRLMINRSGATITGVRELGCYVGLHDSYFALGFRDVLGSGVDVPDGGAITVEYTIGVSA